MTQMSPAQFSDYCRRVSRDLPANIMAAERITADEGMKAALKLSSGPHSLARLRAAGHPYARRRPNPAFDAAIINVQSGRFKKAWISSGPSFVTGGIVTKLTNASPEAKYMSGTKLMVARPVADAIQKTVHPARIQRLQKAIRKSFAP